VAREHVSVRVRDAFARKKAGRILGARAEQRAYGGAVGLAPGNEVQLALVAEPDECIEAARRIARFVATLP
jgi:hypothetical protein